MNRSPNTSSAVMQQRREPHDSLDDFPTPPWATRALCEYVLGLSPDALPVGHVWEPCCNRGYMARPLGEYFLNVTATDIHDYGWAGQEDVRDFLFPGPIPKKGGWHPRWIITNPPFRLADQFILKGLETAAGVAVIVRTGFLEGVERYAQLFSKEPPSVIAQFSERVPMVKGRYDPKASSATSYAWLVWLPDRKSNLSSVFQWIPKCRERLQRPWDCLPYHEEVA